MCTYRCIPIEVLHTILLGLCKYFLKEVMPTLSKVSAFSCSGFRVKSFFERDYKAWSQMALFIISPYIGEGERKVLLALSKVSTQCIISECVSHMVLHYFW